MATHTFVDYEGPQAEELARLTSIEFDLRTVVDMCEYLNRQHKAAEGRMPDSELVDAFSTAILIRYSRAFVSGVRRGLDDASLTCLSQEQRDMHKRLRALRDKHAAHSVNAFEDTRVQARYRLERVQEEGITSVGAAHYRVFGLSHVEVAGARELSLTLRGHVQALINAEKKKLLEAIRRIPVQEVLSAVPSALISPLAKPDKRRARS